MKKSLLALAAMGAFAGTAQAQSSVTVYGILDMGYASINQKSSAAAPVDVTTSGLNVAQPLASSRLGFRGVEDLGGGLTAGFQIEANVHTNPGTTGSNNATAFQFGRHQFVTLESKTAGRVLLGKTDAIVKQIMDSYDAGFSNNLIGAYDGMGVSLSDIDTAAANANVIGNRRDSVLRYTSPSLGGVNLTAGYMKNTLKSETNSVATVDTEDNTGYELGARFAQGKISAGLGYRSAKSQNMAVAAVAAVPATPTTGTVAVAAANTVTNSWAAGLSYDAGPVIGYFQYFNQAIKNELTSTEVKENAFAVGVRAPITKEATLFASYTTGGKTSAANIDSKMTGYQAGGLYALSKRTDLYALYGASKMKADNVANEGTAQGMALGIRHTF